MEKLQDDFHEHMVQKYPDLTRGISKKITHRRHISPQMYKQAATLYEHYDQILGAINAIGMIGNAKAKEEAIELLGHYAPELAKDTPEEKPSDDATIRSISVTNGKLEPDFSPNITEYKVYLPEKTEKLDLTVYTNSEKATVLDYDTSLTAGWNDILITCVAEDSSTRTYAIRAYVEEEPTVFYELNGEKLGVVRNLDKVEYERFKKKETKAGNDTITVFTGSYFRLLYLVNEKGEKDFYLYDKNRNKVTEPFRPLVYNDMYYVLKHASYDEYPYMDQDFIRDIVKVKETEISGWSFKDESQKDFKIICLTDENGDTQLYKFDTRENTVQRYVHHDEKEKGNDLPVYVYIAGGRAAVAMIALAITIISRKKN